MVMPRHGPQALPPGLAEARAAEVAASVASSKRTTPKKKKKRRRRHWDEQDDGVAEMSYGDEGEAINETNGNGDNDTGNTIKKRRVSRQQAVSVGLSYDEGPANGSLSYADEDEDEAEGDDEEGEASDDDVVDNKDDRDYTLGHRDLYESSVGDARGYYHDGAYVAAPAEEDYGSSSAGGHANGHDRTVSGEDGVNDNDNASVDPGAESARFSAAYRSRLLLIHFAELRAIVRPFLESYDPDQLADAVAALPPDHDTDVGPLSTKSGVYRRWLHLLRTTDPLPAQIAAMDKVSVLRLLRVLLRGLLAGGSSSSRSSRAGRFEQKLLGGGGSGGGGHGNSNGSTGIDMTGRTSRWLWSLFARLPDRGELDYREVGYIRDVAKQAVMRLAHLSYDMDGADVHGGGDYEEEEEQGENEVPAQTETAEATQAEPIKDENENEKAEGKEDPEDVPMDMESEPETGEVKAAEDANTAKEDEKPEDVLGEDKAGQEDEDGEMQQRATLEMVLAVAGEFYGQRDLLAFRTPWPATSSN